MDIQGQRTQVPRAAGATLIGDCRSSRPLEKNQPQCPLGLSQPDLPTAHMTGSEIDVNLDHIVGSARPAGSYTARRNIAQYEVVRIQENESMPRRVTRA